MRRAPTRSDCLGASPRRVLHADALRLDLSRSLSRQQELHDWQAIKQMFASGERGGYWAADAGSFYEDSAGTIPASLNGVIGARANAISSQPSAVQATTANKPYLRRTPQTNLYWAESNTATSALIATFGSSLGSTCTVARVGPDGVSLLENQTIGTTYNIAQSYGWNGDVMVINRVLSAAEKAIVTRYMLRRRPQLGSELVSNGNFDVDASGWLSSNSTLTIVDGRLRVTNVGTVYGGAGKLINTGGAGRQFFISVALFKQTASSLYVNIGSSLAATNIAQLNSLTSKTVYLAIRSIGDYCYITLLNANTNNSYSDFDNVTAREIL